MHVVDQLLKHDKMVCAAVRSERAAKTVRTNFQEYIKSNQLRIGFIDDLTQPESFQTVLDETITSIIHVASPLPMGKNIQDNEREMLGPAIAGTTAVLEAANMYASPSFRRVVQISSVSAMLDLSKGPRPGYVYTEADWNPVTYEEAAMESNSTLLYVSSKALSEKAVWEWAARNNPRFDIVCLCPSTVFGPHIETIDSMTTLHSTASLLWNLIDAPQIPALEFAGAIDVRDAALMVAAAVDKPDASGKRLLLAEHFDWQSAADAAREGLPQEARSRIPVGKPGYGRDEALRNLYAVNGSKAVEVLGVRYRSLAETVIDTLKQFLELEAREKAS